MSAEPAAGAAAKTFVKRCFVPRCPNTSSNAPNITFFSVPKTASRARWINVIEEATGVKLVITSQKSGHYCCEEHFNVSASLKIIVIIEYEEINTV